MVISAQLDGEATGFLRAAVHPQHLLAKLVLVSRVLNIVQPAVTIFCSVPLVEII